MKVGILWSVFLSVLIAGCGQNEGPDSISSHTFESSGCGVCHVRALNGRRPVSGSQGDFARNPAIASHHVAGTDEPTEEQCQVCHDQSNHMEGTVILKDADTGAPIVYNPASPSSLEPFCLSCHDADGAIVTSIGASDFEPFSNGSVLGNPPYPYAKRIATSWAKPYGHGPNGDHAPSDQLTCMGAGELGTGCHGSSGTINAHGSVNLLLATRNYNYNINIYDENDFTLCFTCHANYTGVTKEDTLGVKQGGLLDSDYGFIRGGNGLNGWNPPYYTPGVTTYFADHNELGGAYNDTGNWWTPNANLHWAHLGYPSSYRANSRISCINCHDVHGSATQYGAVYDEIGYFRFGDPINTLGQMQTQAYTTSLLENNPTFCSFNCHPIQGVTNAWFEPIVE